MWKFMVLRDEEKDKRRQKVKKKVYTEKNQKI